MHEANRAPEYSGFNAFSSDPLLDLLTVTLKQSVRNDFARMGEWAGQAETLNLGRLANMHTPTLETHDAYGDRLDLVEFHPSWHALMRKGVQAGLHNSIWGSGVDEAGGRNLVRSVRVYMTAGVEMGHLCPLIMTNASVSVLKRNAAESKDWLIGISSIKYDPSNRPAHQKNGILLGMGMTERQGGSDMRANTTTAQSHDSSWWRINGHKWFLSAPSCDGFLVLAQTARGSSCFLLPRLLYNGMHNGLHFQRLKDKLGNRSNASSEVEFNNAFGMLIGEEGQGIQTIMEMVSYTRMDCAIASAGLMRASLAEAIHHCRYRFSFGAKLIEQPLMQRVLADMCLDVSAATALAFRLASAFDRANANPEQAAYARLMTPVIKYWVCKLAPSIIYEAMECIGGNGYMESFNMARHYREAPFNAIWEGAGNIMCLDVIRLLGKDSELLEMVLAGLNRDLGGDSATKLTDVIRSAAVMACNDVGSARILIEQLALTAAAAELRRVWGGESAEAFIETRLGGPWRNTYGMFDNRYNARQILEKDYPSFG